MNQKDDIIREEELQQMFIMLFMNKIQIITNNVRSFSSVIVY